MILFRSYQAGDECQLVRLWNQTMQVDPITPERFRNLVLLDANFDPLGLRVAVGGEQIIGAVYAVRRLLPMYGTELEPEHGWILFFFVDSSYRRQGIGRRLLDEALEFLREQGRSTVFVSSYAPGYITPGVDQEAYPEAFSFLQQYGFRTRYSPVAMDYSLVSFRIPDKVVVLKQRREEEGYTFRTALDQDLYELIRFATEVFNPDWGRAIREGILQGLPMSSILVAEYENRIVGFCLHGGYEGIRERFGPFGVDPGQQGKGLGTILLYDCLAAMRAKGLHGAWFLWTGEQTPAGQLYKKAGFSVTRTFHVLSRSL